MGLSPVRLFVLIGLGDGDRLLKFTAIAGVNE